MPIFSFIYTEDARTKQAVDVLLFSDLAFLLDCVCASRNRLQLLACSPMVPLGRPCSQGELSLCNVGAPFQGLSDTLAALEELIIIFITQQINAC